jgi:hypothetical protein
MLAATITQLVFVRVVPFWDHETNKAHIAILLRIEIPFIVLPGRGI